MARRYAGISLLQEPLLNTDQCAAVLTEVIPNAAQVAAEVAEEEGVANDDLVDLPCPWMTGNSGADNMMQCNDGSQCSIIKKPVIPPWLQYKGLQEQCWSDKLEYTYIEAGAGLGPVGSDDMPSYLIYPELTQTNTYVVTFKPPTMDEAHIQEADRLRFSFINTTKTWQSYSSWEDAMLECEKTPDCHGVDNMQFKYYAMEQGWQQGFEDTWKPALSSGRLSTECLASGGDLATCQSYTEFSTWWTENQVDLNPYGGPDIYRVTHGNATLVKFPKPQACGSYQCAKTWTRTLDRSCLPSEYAG
jgi:hypothetical protein